LFRICDLSFADVYYTMAERVLDRHLSILQFAGLLFSVSTEQMSETISLLTLADCIAFKCVSSDLTRLSTFICLHFSGRWVLIGSFAKCPQSAPLSRFHIDTGGVGGTQLVVEGSTNPRSDSLHPYKRILWLCLTIVGSGHRC
jgi:hypothetical protein